MLKRIAIFALPLVAFYVSHYYGVIDFTSVSEHHFDIITVNSIFAGFLFSSLSLILGLGKDSTVVFLERIKELNKIYSNIITGIVCSILSIAAALIGLFVSGVNLEILTAIEIYFLVMIIIFFIKSVLDIKFVIGLIRKEIKRELPDPRIIKKALDEMKQ